MELKNWASLRRRCWTPVCVFNVLTDNQLIMTVSNYTIKTNSEGLHIITCIKKGAQVREDKTRGSSGFHVYLIKSSYGGWLPVT